MTATINWVIQQMDCIPQEDGQTDVVVTAHWRCNGEQVSNGQTYYGTTYGTASFSYTPGDPFTPYADLTQDQVLGWCWANGVNKAANETNVQGQINAQINPPIVTPPLPWAASSQA